MISNGAPPAESNGSEGIISGVGEALMQFLAVKMRGRSSFRQVVRDAQRLDALCLRQEAWLVLLLLLLSAFGMSCQKGSTLTEAQNLPPSQVVELYVRWVRTGLAEKAYALRTAEIRSQLDFESFKAFVEHGQHDNPMGWEAVITIKPLRETMLSSTVAQVEVEYQRQGQKLVMMITCRKEDGIWKLGAFG